MIRRIKPASRVIRINTEVNRIKKAPLRREKIQDWDHRWLPRVDIYEKPSEIIVEAEIPGVSQSDITITVQSSRVEIKGVKRESGAPGEIHYLRLEREFGSFRRLVTLPNTVSPDKAKAFLDNGVLRIFLKKYLSGEDKEVSIEIRKTED